MELLVLAAMLAAAPCHSPISRLEPDRERPVVINLAIFRWPQNKPVETALQFSWSANFSQPMQAAVNGESLYRPSQPMQVGR